MQPYVLGAEDAVLKFAAPMDWLRGLLGRGNLNSASLPNGWFGLAPIAGTEDVRAQLANKVRGAVTNPGRPVANHAAPAALPEMNTGELRRLIENRTGLGGYKGYGPDGRPADTMSHSQVRRILEQRVGPEPVAPAAPTPAMHHTNPVFRPGPLPTPEVRSVPRAAGPAAPTNALAPGKYRKNEALPKDHPGLFDPTALRRKRLVDPLNKGIDPRGLKLSAEHALELFGRFTA